MPSHVALLRGVNVGGHRKVTMAELRSVAEDLGHAEVATHLQSGNLLFRPRSRRTRPDTLARGLSEAIETEFGAPVPVLIRSHDELGALLTANPFLSDHEAKALHVTFLDSAPQTRLEDDARFAPDRFRAVGREIFVATPGGYGRTKLNNRFFERSSSRVATTRSWKTVLALQEKTAP